MRIFTSEGLSNWNKPRKNGMFKIIPRKKTAPPVTHRTALLGETIILKILAVHDLLVNITAMFDAISVMNVIALTSPGEYNMLREVK